MFELPTTHDGLLNRQVKLEQPKAGFRVAIDTVFLASAVPAMTGENILDMGCGVGGAMLCVACRVDGLCGTGVEIQQELVEICRRNFARNGFAVDLRVRQGDVLSLPVELREVFDHVMINPPFHQEARHDVSENRIKKTANTEKNGDLILWLGAAGAALKTAGTLTVIHRADRRDEIVSHLHEIFGSVEVLELVPRQGEEPKRIIVRARKGNKSGVHLCAPLVLHKPEGGYTNAAEDILRHTKALSFV
jgi:tRNA1(Val) A37 N6-methylase TrmN6